MSERRRLDHLLRDSARRSPEALALSGAGVRVGLRFNELAELVESIAASLRDAGLEPGDRIGVHLRKSYASVASLLGVMSAGAAYVPLDASAPLSRSAYIVRDCGLRLVITTEDRVADLGAEIGDGAEAAGVIDLDHEAGRLCLVATHLSGADDRPALPDGEELAYVLYTSGSTGLPKGVMHSHDSALAFVDWCSATLEPAPDDVFSSHAPFHFDLSILDLYLPLKHGARLALVPDDVARQPKALAAFIAAEKISVWYSTPSILTLMCGFGKLADRDCSQLRLVLFAGEVFPPKNLQALRAIWPHPRYMNLYGPTETNVCTWHELPAGAIDGETPIGRVCAPDRALVVDVEDREVAAGAEGELLVAGGTVMKGYWNLPERNAAAFFVAPDGGSYYRTGDIVRARDDGEAHLRRPPRPDGEAPRLSRRAR